MQELLSVNEFLCRTSVSNQDKRVLLFLLAPSFSGSTLLTLMLAQHPEIATIGELKATAMGAVESYFCSCGEKLTRCRFWQDIKRIAFQLGITFNLENFGTHFAAENRMWNRVLRAQLRGPLFERFRKTAIKSLPDLRAYYLSVLEQNRRLIEIICRLQGGKIFLDGSKDAHRLLYLKESGFWDIRVIRMHRDGRGQSNSRRNKLRRPVDFKRAVREWRNTIVQMDLVCEKFEHDKVFTLNYEKLCQSPNQVLTEIWRFLGLEPVDRNWNEIDLKAADHHILGNSMRTKEQIRISLDEKWRRQNTARELEVFDKLAGHMNRRLGYQ